MSRKLFSKPRNGAGDDHVPLSVYGNRFLVVLNELRENNKDTEDRIIVKAKEKGWTPPGFIANAWECMNPPPPRRICSTTTLEREIFNRSVLLTLIDSARHWEVDDRAAAELPDPPAFGDDSTDKLYRFLLCNKGDFPAVISLLADISASGLTRVWDTAVGQSPAGEELCMRGGVLTEVACRVLQASDAIEDLILVPADILATSETAKYALDACVAAQYGICASTTYEGTRFSLSALPGHYVGTGYAVSEAILRESRITEARLQDLRAEPGVKRMRLHRFLSLLYTSAAHCSLFSTAYGLLVASLCSNENVLPSPGKTTSETADNLGHMPSVRVSSHPYSRSVAGSRLSEEVAATSLLTTDCRGLPSSSPRIELPAAGSTAGIIRAVAGMASPSSSGLPSLGALYGNLRAAGIPIVPNQRAGAAPARQHPARSSESTPAGGRASSSSAGSGAGSTQGTNPRSLFSSQDGTIDEDGAGNTDHLDDRDGFADLDIYIDAAGNAVYGGGDSDPGEDDGGDGGDDGGDDKDGGDDDNDGGEDDDDGGEDDDDGGDDDDDGDDSGDSGGDGGDDDSADDDDEVSGDSGGDDDGGTTIAGATDLCYVIAIAATASVTGLNTQQKGSGTYPFDLSNSLSVRPKLAKQHKGGEYTAAFRRCSIWFIRSRSAEGAGLLGYNKHGQPL